MLSRVANSLFWIGRYFERAENLARMVDVNLQLQLDFERVDDDSLKDHWGAILRSAGDEEQFLRAHAVADAVSVPDFLTFSRENPNSVASCVAAARENARMIRDQVTVEMWEVINELHLFLQARDAREVWEPGAGEFFGRIKSTAHLFRGLVEATFPRGPAYDFLHLGMHLERADKTIRILDLKYHILLPSVADVGGAVDTAQWRALLRSASALEAYRSHYVSDLLPWKIAEFLLLSETFPRSVRFCLGQVDQALRRISGTAPGRHSNEAERLCGRLLSDLSYTSTEEVFRRGLHEFLTGMLPVLDRIAANIYDTFMAYTEIEDGSLVRLHQQEDQQQQAGAASRL